MDVMLTPCNKTTVGPLVKESEYQIGVPSNDMTVRSNTDKTVAVWETTRDRRFEFERLADLACATPVEGTSGTLSKLETNVDGKWTEDPVRGPIHRSTRRFGTGSSDSVDQLACARHSGSY
jgi:hypothetical protein